VGVPGWCDGGQSNTLFNSPHGIAIDAAEAALYVSELHRIRRIPLGQDIVSTVAAVGIAGFADGPPTLAQFNQPMGLAVTQTGDLLIADAGNYRIRRVSPSGTVTTVAGDGVPAVPTDKPQFADRRPALNARFEAPGDLVVDPAGMVWVADVTHVRMYSPITNTVSTACSDRGTHQQPIEFGGALGGGALGIALLGENILVADSEKNQIFLLTPQAD
jgi:DNA-binding beta-propeller fold protein YncE